MVKQRRSSRLRQHGISVRYTAHRIASIACIVQSSLVFGVIVYDRVRRNYCEHKKRPDGQYDDRSRGSRLGFDPGWKGGTSESKAKRSHSVSQIV